MADQTAHINEFQKEIPCNICGSNTRTVVYESTFELESDAHEILDRFRDKGGDMLLDQVVKCTCCGLVYISPRLKDDIVTREYQEASIQGYKEQFVSQNTGREIAFRRSMKHIGKLCAPPGTLLDVGAANGAFMAVAREHGWNVRGCEPNEWFCRWGNEHYGLSIDQGILFDQNYTDGSFDLITLWDVIEHVPDPAQLLKKCFALLKPGGILLCTYPDIESWIARLMGRRWVFLMSVHLYYFTQKTLTTLLEQSGFSVQRFSAHFQTLQFGYIVYRLQDHNRALYILGKILLKIFRLDSLMVPYWVGINCAAARKKVSGSK